MSTRKESPFHLSDDNIGYSASDTAIVLQEEGYTQNFSWKVSKHIAAFCISINRYAAYLS